MILRIMFGYGVSSMIHSYLRDNGFESINRLLDQFCQRCQKVSICDHGCKLSHRKNSVCIPFPMAVDTEQAMLEVN